MSGIVYSIGSVSVYYSSLVIALGVASCFCLTWALFRANGGKAAVLCLFLALCCDEFSDADLIHPVFLLSLPSYPEAGRNTTHRRLIGETQPPVEFSQMAQLRGFHSSRKQPV